MKCQIGNLSTKHPRQNHQFSTIHHLVLVKMKGTHFIYSSTPWYLFVSHFLYRELEKKNLVQRDERYQLHPSWGSGAEQVHNGVLGVLPEYPPLQAQFTGIHRSKWLTYGIHRSNVHWHCEHCSHGRPCLHSMLYHFWFCHSVAFGCQMDNPLLDNSQPFSPNTF